MLLSSIKVWPLTAITIHHQWYTPSTNLSSLGKPSWDIPPAKHPVLQSFLIGCVPCINNYFGFFSGAEEIERGLKREWIKKSKHKDEKNLTNKQTTGWVGKPKARLQNISWANFLLWDITFEKKSRQPLRIASSDVHVWAKKTTCQLSI